MDIQQILLAKKREIEAKLNAKSASQDTSLPSAPNASPACSSGHPLLSKPIQFQRLPSNLRTGKKFIYNVTREQGFCFERDQFRFRALLLNVVLS